MSPGVLSWEWDNQDQREQFLTWSRQYGRSGGKIIRTDIMVEGEKSLRADNMVELEKNTWNKQFCRSGKKSANTEHCVSSQSQIITIMHNQQNVITTDSKNFWLGTSGIHQKLILPVNEK